MIDTTNLTSETATIPNAARHLPSSLESAAVNLPAPMLFTDEFGTVGNAPHWLLDLNAAQTFATQLNGKRFNKTSRLYVNNPCTLTEVVRVASLSLGFAPTAQIENNLLLARGNEAACITLWNDKACKVTTVWLVALTEEQSGLEASLKRLEDAFKANFSVIDSGRITVKFTRISGDGEFNYETFHTVIGDRFHREAYPFISDPTSLIQQYLAAEESALLLYGSPGTGKSRFCRWILQTASTLWTDLRVYFAQSEQVLATDELYIQFLKDERARILVIEDADVNLMSRRDGNALMAKFLTLTDGLIKPIETKKVIFTTNLNINSIDEALLRVGRTFASLNFEKLNREQASRFLQTIGATAELSGNEFSLAELYRMSRNGKGSTNGQ